MTDMRSESSTRMNSMSKNDTFSVEVTKKELQDRLVQSLSGPYKELVAETLMGCLQQVPVGNQLLFMAFAGVQKQFIYVPGDKVYVKKDYIASWRCNLEAMKKAGIIFQNYIEATVISTDRYLSSPIKVSYPIINDKGEYKKDESTFGEMALIMGERFPLIHPPVEDSLPF